MASIHINPKAIEGKTFTVGSDSAEHTCIGYAANDTFLIVGATFDPPNNRSTIRTFKVSEVKFKGEITVPTS